MDDEVVHFSDITEHVLNGVFYCPLPLTFSVKIQTLENQDDGTPPNKCIRIARGERQVKPERIKNPS